MKNKESISFTCHNKTNTALNIDHKKYREDNENISLTRQNETITTLNIDARNVDSEAKARGER
ncbi:hypothetical protein E2C01_018508 [Portunus trituberculatus]|uniref:Uncharacterized protein n=1 Tax=Portunus trituberculatus TaxID=210409 RepID=A0A5B7DVB9_PORTR|nr:hypothetical protein [Portunus trituberculatus]